MNKIDPFFQVNEVNMHAWYCRRMPVPNSQGCYKGRKMNAFAAVLRVERIKVAIFVILDSIFYRLVCPFLAFLASRIMV